MSNWAATTLNQIGRIVTGKTPPTNDPANYGDAVPFITPTDMDGRRIIDRTGRSLSVLGAERVRSSFLPEPAVLVSCIGSDMGKTVLSAGPCVTNQQINSIIVSKEHDALFVYYNLLMRRSELRNLAGGAAQPILNKTDFGRLPIDVPPIEDQRKISAILAALDDKIELNRRMNDTLEAMARAIFKDWFVDFGPTRAKMEGRAPYLAPEIWALFPAVLDVEGLPRGWGNFRLNQLASIAKGSISPLSEPQETFEHFSLPAFDAGQAPTLDMGETIKSNKVLVPADAVLLSKLNPEISRVWLTGPKGQFTQVASTEFLAFQPLGSTSRALLYCLFCSDPFKAMLESMVTGTSKSHQRVSPSALLDQSVLAANPRVWQAFAPVVSPFLERQIANRVEIQTLAATRDLLLPKLMSGEIRVRDAEKIVEAAQ